LLTISQSEHHTGLAAGKLLGVKGSIQWTV